MPEGGHKGRPKLTLIGLSTKAKFFMYVYFLLFDIVSFCKIGHPQRRVLFFILYCYKGSIRSMKNLNVCYFRFVLYQLSKNLNRPFFMDFLTQLSIRYTEKSAVLDEEDPEDSGKHFPALFHFPDIMVFFFQGDNLVSMLLKPSYTTQESEKVSIYNVYHFVLFCAQARLKYFFEEFHPYLSILRKFKKQIFQIMVKQSCIIFSTSYAGTFYSTKN